MPEWMAGLVVIATRTISNKTKNSQQETQQCPCSSRPQDILRTSHFFLYAFHLECSRIRVRPAVESKSMLRLVVTKLMVPACGRCCWEHTTKGAEGAILAKGCARDRGGGELRRCRGCARADCMRSRNLSKYSKKTRKLTARETEQNGRRLERDLRVCYLQNFEMVSVQKVRKRG